MQADFNRLKWETYNFLINNPSYITSILSNSLNFFSKIRVCINKLFDSQVSPLSPIFNANVKQLNYLILSNLKSMSHAKIIFFL